MAMLQLHFKSERNLRSSQTYWRQDIRQHYHSVSDVWHKVYTKLHIQHTTLNAQCGLYPAPVVCRFSLFSFPSLASISFSVSWQEACSRSRSLRWYSAVSRLNTYNNKTWVKICNNYTWWKNNYNYMSEHLQKPHMMKHWLHQWVNKMSQENEKNLWPRNIPTRMSTHCRKVVATHHSKVFTFPDEEHSLELVVDELWFLLYPVTAFVFAALKQMFLCSTSVSQDTSRILPLTQVTSITLPPLHQHLQVSPS